jgi:hypothetical protein
MLQGLGGKAGLYAANASLVSEYYARGAPQAAGLKNVIVNVPGLVPSLAVGGAQINVKLAFLAIPIPPTTTTAAAPDGVAIMPLITGQASDMISLTDTLSIKLAGDVLARPVRAEFHPGKAVMRASPGDAHVNASARLDAKAAANAPWIPFGTSDSSHLELSAAHVAFGLSGQVDGDTELTAEIGLDTASLVIDFSEGDSLLKDTVSSQPTKSALSFTIKWSSKTGFALGGQPKLAITIPVQESLAGVATLQAIGFALGATSDGRLEFDAMLTGSTSIGPVKLEVQNVGLAVYIIPSADSSPPGALGNIDFGFGFKSPTGVGAAIDVACLTGGGFLSHDDAASQYAGMLDLTVSDITVKAYGIIQTKLPGGVPGYSFIVALSAEFIPGIQLPFGFSLDGVGGIVGINRTIAVDAIEAALWAHHLDGLLFPKDLIASAPQLIVALDSYFPPANGRYLIGPMAKIGWGDGIVEGEIALLLELPEPLKLLLLGEIEVGVPMEKPQLELHISFDGGLDFGKKLAFFDATLHDSRIESFPIIGDLAFRDEWGGDGSFALALGGFNPHFQPPASFPTLKRLSITIGSSVAQIEAQAYIALTANTLQFGARVEVTAGTGSFNVHGWLGIDALCERHPMSFTFDLSAGIDLRDGTNVLASVSTVICPGRRRGTFPARLRSAFGWSTSACTSTRRGATSPTHCRCWTHYRLSSRL